MDGRQPLLMGAGVRLLCPALLCQFIRRPEPKQQHEAERVAGKSQTPAALLPLSLPSPLKVLSCRAIFFLLQRFFLAAQRPILAYCG